MLVDCHDTRQIQFLVEIAVQETPSLGAVHMSHDP